MGKLKLEQELKVSYEQKLCQIRSLLDKSQEFEGELYSIRKCGLDIDVFKNVFSPGYFEDSEYFANNMPDAQGLKVLEVGTGTGLIALTLALKKAEKVVATDINHEAFLNARHNVTKHNMESVIELREGDIFVPLRNDKPKFDLIFWNIPFCYVDAKLNSEIGLHDNLNDLEKSVFNPYYHYLYDYLNEGFDFLAEGGRLLLGFSPTIGRADHLEVITRMLKLDNTPVVEGDIEIEGNVETLQILEFKKR
jgi:release factor glutamine methyltransferase